MITISKIGFGNIKKLTSRRAKARVTVIGTDSIDYNEQKVDRYGKNSKTE